MTTTNEEKNDVDPQAAVRLLHPMHTVLVTCKGKTGKPNIITLAWTMPTSMEPPLVAISVRPNRHSHKLIEQTREFVINIPTMNLVKETLFCGRRSGKDHDKFRATGLTPKPAKLVKLPIIKECIAHLECRLHSQFTTGDHTIFIGEIIAAYADRQAFTDTYNLKKARSIFHVGGSKFATLNPRTTEPELSPT